MPEEHKAASTTIKHEGTFDIDHVVSTLRNWLKTNLYGYLEKKQRYAADGRSINVEGDKKTDDYAKFALEIKLEAENLKEVEVIKDNTKTTKHQGKIVIKITSKLTLDHVKRYDKEPWTHVRTLLHKTLLKHRIDKYSEEIDDDVMTLTRALRDALELEV